MYQTSGFVNRDLLTQIGGYFIPYQSRMVFRVCINLFVILFFGFICVLKLLPAAIMLAIAIFFVRARQSTETLYGSNPASAERAIRKCTDPLLQ